MLLTVIRQLSQRFGIGWSGDKYLHATPIHLSLIGEKVWIQHDDTQEGVATDLLADGVLK